MKTKQITVQVPEDLNDCMKTNCYLCYFICKGHNRSRFRNEENENIEKNNRQVIGGY